MVPQKVALFNWQLCKNLAFFREKVQELEKLSVYSYTIYNNDNF